jgi:hypothetical protein
MAKANTPPGPGVDATGQAVIDPTENVKALSEADNRRQDDLRKAEARRQEDLRKADAKHTKEIRRLDRSHAKELRDIDGELRRAESERLDAIRLVDKGNIDRAAEVAAASASVLAEQLVANATAARGELITGLQPVQADVREIRDKLSQQQGGKAQETEGGIRAGQVWLIVGIVIAALVGLAGLFITAIGTAAAIYFARR